MTERMPAIAKLSRFFWTPKGLLIVILVAFIAIAMAAGAAHAWPGVVAAAIAAMIVDAPILRVRKGAWEFPSGALLTGLIVAMVLSPEEPWMATAATAVVGVLSKYLARTKTANVFNPAALGLVATFYVFDTGQSWWGALPDASWYGLAALLASGLFITQRVNKAPLVLSFLGVYYLLFTIATFVGDPARFVEIYRAPDLQAVLYFAFFIVTDPPTSPPRYRAQIVCGILVAVVSCGIFAFVGAAYYLLAGVLAGNLWEAARRIRGAQITSRVARASA